MIPTRCRVWLPRLALAAGLLLSLAACSVTGVEDIEQPLGADQEPTPQYDTHVLLYGNALAGVDQSTLAAFDLLIVEAQVFDDLLPAHRSRALLYFDPWAKSCYTDSTRNWPEWQPAPGEIGEPEIVLGGAYCYRFDNAHVADFLHWIESFLVEHGSQVAGVFLDDFSYDRDWWDGAPEDRDVVWGPMDGGPGWRESPAGWNHQRILDIERGARDLVRDYCGPDGVVVVNGTARSLDDVRRFAEDVGSPNNESWDRLEVPGVDERRYVRAGDLLQVYGVGETGQWGDWTVTASGHGLTNLRRAALLARERGASVGLAYGEPPLSGDSRASLILPPNTPGQEWPYYFDETP
ncbi:MAG: hypothetical protein R3C71_02225 [Candidatus Krumholzibacteriia bacterium]|nr:hypothetical protein [bacterium]MCB9515309.1 hypothetical protein [Candidatus Latescibacterota bacterium]